MDAMSVPDKYKQLGEFWKYFTGEKRAPLLTIFIGGNHEASNYLRELFYGGYAAPNIYFLGTTGVIDLVIEQDGKEHESLTIAGISGIE
jgi:lariat debranching enzyme